jgi:hypothetical protein
LVWLFLHVYGSLRTIRVVLSNVLGGKDVVEGRDGQTCRIVIGHIRIKMELHSQIRVYILPLVNTVGRHGILKGEVDFHASISSMYRGAHTTEGRVRMFARGRERLREGGACTSWGGAYGSAEGAHGLEGRTW